MTYSFLIISSLCMNVSEQKKHESVNVIVRTVLSGPLLLHLTSLSQLFEKFVQSLQSPNFTWKFLNKFSAP